MTNSYDNEDGTTPLSGLDRDRVWREWGIDLQDTTRMADDPEWAQECLWRWRGGEYIRGLRHHRPAPGDLERLESIAAGHGDPRTVPAIGVALLIGAGVLMGRMLS